MHFCADGDTIEIFFRTSIHVDRLSIYGVNTTLHTSHFLTDSHAHAWLKAQVVCLSCAHHVSSSFVLTLFDYSTFLTLLTIISLIIPVLPLAHQLHLPGCGGQIPCALSLMITLAPLPSTTLSHWL